MRSRPRLVTGLVGLVLLAPAVPGAAVGDDGAGPAASTPAAFDTGPARAALVRLLGERADQITLVAADPTTTGDHFEVRGRTGHVVVEATSNATLLTGANWYLKRVAGAGITWNGDAVDRLPGVLPAPGQPIAEDTAYEHRFVGNDTVSGYTGPYWTWQDWQREIDVLAANGANEVLVYPGQAMVYYRTFQEFGYTAEEMRQWIPLPAHQPWWLLQNMCCFPAAISERMLAEQAALGRRIVDRLRALDITPVLPGYYGTVPSGFAERNPGANTVPQGTWGGFQRPDWLDPRDPYFGQVAEAFYRHQRELFGDTSMYKMDLLHEGGQAGDVPVTEAASEVQAALDEAHPEATWVILGWQSNPRPELLAGVDRDRMLIVDGLSDRYDGLDREADWQGTPYAFGSIWNFGGHTAIGANLGVWAERFHAWASQPDSALDGIAVMPEANDNNPAAFAFLSELAWLDGPVDVAAWMRDFARWRYGGDDPAAARAWRALAETAYAMPSGSWSEAPDGLFGARPSLTVRSAASWSPGELRYDPVRFATALSELLVVRPKLRSSPAYRHDVVDVARQVLSNHSRILLPQLAAAHEAGAADRFDRLAGRWLAYLRLLDRVLGSDPHFLLGRWLADARSWSGRGDRAAVEYDARSILTHWGTRAGSEEGLHDYANREWAGLVGDHYRDRWRRYFDELTAALAEDREPKPIDWFAVDNAWAQSRDSYPTRPAGDPHRLASAVARTLAADPSTVVVSTEADPVAVMPGETATVTVRVRNQNPWRSASRLRVELAAPRGWDVRPVTPAPGSVEPGESIAATFEVTVPADVEPASAMDEVRLRADATFRLGASRRSAPAWAELLVPHPVDPAHRTAAFTDAAFGQRDDAYAIHAAGADMWGGTNEFATIYRDGGLEPNAVARTRVVAQDPTGPWARAGIVVRNDLAVDGSAGYLNLAITPSNGCVLSWDSDGDGRLDQVRQHVGVAAPAQLRLRRDGTTYVGECSTDGETWHRIGEAEVASAVEAQDVGLFSTAANGGSGAAGLARFEGFEVTAG